TSETRSAKVAFSRFAMKNGTSADGLAARPVSMAVQSVIAPTEGGAHRVDGGALIESGAARISESLQSAYGNQVLDAALSGDGLDGFGPLVASELVAGLAGLDGGSPLASNQAMARIHRSAAGLELEVAHDAIHSSSGRSLPDATRERMEQAFERDLGRVRVHTDAAAGRAAEALNAHAFALGADIFFGHGAFAPGT